MRRNIVRNRFRRKERRADRRLFARALEEFIEFHSKESITERLNKIFHTGSDHSEENVDNLSVELL